MPMDEVIRAIEETDAENIQDVLQAVIGRYRKLYPQWRILLLSADPSDAGKRNKQFLKLISKAEQISGIKRHDFPLR